MNDTDKKILAQIKQAVLAVDANAELILFGSRARGDYRANSDWDVLVLTSDKVNLAVKTKFREPLFKVEIKNEIVLNSVIVNQQKWYNQFTNYPLFYEVKKDGILL